MQNHKPKILVCPLDWGLGHATRCVAIIEELLLNNAEVIIAADNRPLYFLQTEFPNLKFIKFPGFSVSYPSSGNMTLKMLWFAPSIIYHIFKENYQLKKFIKNHQIDAVISDNRFGLWNKKIPSIFITHQVKIKSPIFENIINYLNSQIIARYYECWIPDTENKLSGELSKNYLLKSRLCFIGTLSRFRKSEKKIDVKYQFAAIISGPEPQRTILENLIISELKKTKIKSVVLLGKTEDLKEWNENENIDVFSHLPTSGLQQILEASEVIISRPGYSSIMDIARLEKKAIFVPTPGQTEQEYLAKFLSEKGMGIYFNQENFNLENCLPLLQTIGPLKETENELLSKKIKPFLEMIKSSKIK
jgi:uncharacterized protein (TIGR00661 family)